MAHSGHYDVPCRSTKIEGLLNQNLQAFALASWFLDCVPVSPVLYLLGPDNEARLVLRLLGCICHRSVLLADVDLAALATLPRSLNPTLLMSQCHFGRRITQILLSSSNPKFCVTRGKSQVYAYGAKAFCAELETAESTGVRVSLTPALDVLPHLTPADEKARANDLQAKLLRYFMLNCERVREASVDTRDFVPAMRDEAHAWLAPICDCPDLSQSVRTSLLQQNQQLEAQRLSDDGCLTAEAALFFCHDPNRDRFFVREEAVEINTLLKGRCEERSVSDKMAGSFLRKLGIRAEKVTKGYRVLLTDSVRAQIHQIAADYQVSATQDGVARCRHCSAEKTHTPRSRARMNV